MIKRHKALEMKEGDGVNVKRLMPIAGFRNYDPFVLWDDLPYRSKSILSRLPHQCQDDLADKTLCTPQ